MMPTVYIIKNAKPIDELTFRFLLQFAPAEKQERILRQHVKQNADNMLVGAALARHMIWVIFQIPLSQQHIAYGSYGKPYLRDSPNAHFNISHSGQYVACAVANQPVGIDVQEITPYRSDVARRICNDIEFRKIETSAKPAEEFTKLWTYKEAYGKWSGVGIRGITSIVEPINNMHSKTYPLIGAFLTVTY